MNQNLPAHTTDTAGGIEPIATAPKTLMQKGVEKLRQHAELKQMAFDYADFITKTGACPTIYKGKPLDAAAAIIRGTALGFDPDGALEAFFVIQGKTGMYARAMIAVAENVGCRVWEEEATDDSVTWCGTRPGDDKVERVTWDTARVKLAGYDKNAKYKSNPLEMKRAKCQSELARILAPGALMGLVSEAEPDALAPVRATATRTDRKQAGGARAALSAAAQQTAQPEPEDTVVDDVLSSILAEIQDAPDRPTITEIMARDEVKSLDGADHDQVSSAANERWQTLA